MFPVILVYISLLIIVNCSWRRGIAEAVAYGRNKKEKKRFYRETPMIRHILRFYPSDVCHAPRHLKLYCFFRTFNAAVLVVSTVLTLIFVPSIDEYKFWYFIIYASILFIPVLVEFLYVAVKSPPGWKTVDFGIFKNP